MPSVIQTTTEFEVRTLAAKPVFTSPNRDIAHKWARERKRVLGELAVFEVVRSVEETRLYTHRVRASATIVASEAA